MPLASLLFGKNAAGRLVFFGYGGGSVLGDGGTTSVFDDHWHGSGGDSSSWSSCSIVVDSLESDTD
jgi:hypothetical protein